MRHIFLRGASIIAARLLQPLVELNPPSANRNSKQRYARVVNVFEDMGLPDAQERLAKAEVARVIRKAIERRGLTQSEAAELLAVKQPDISDLMRGKLTRFSRERLERFLNALDLEVRIQIGPRPRGKRRAGISVEVVGSFR